ncbi:MAG: vitamin B12-dependent ribonucleotide reductase [Candidatus Aenigmatarchaeota archaeon]
MSIISKVKKRDGRIVDFDESKIALAVWKAAESVGGKDRKRADELAASVVKLLEEKFGDGNVPSVEDVQDATEKVLIEEGHAAVAKAYILYRQKRAEGRKMKSMLGVNDELKLSLNAIKVMASRYLRRDEERNIVESTAQLFRRVARAIAEPEAQHGGEERVKEYEDAFYRMMVNREFMPNSPTLMNAGTDLGQLSACFVLPVPDSISGIFDSIKYTAIIHKSGGGTGFSFSRLRPKGDVVRSTGGIASGPLSFMQVFNAATEVIKQGGKRRGANMGMLRVDHPDILEFITAKEREGILSNFNISVAVTDKFMQAVERNGEYDLINPRDKKPGKSMPARAVFNLMVMMAWKNGEPGVVFINKVNAANPTPALGEIESTNPCGEQPLLSYESCNLGSINLERMMTNGDIDWEKLRRTVRLAVRFLDNVVEVNKYPVPEIEEMTRTNRKIGLGVMGFADMLIKMGVPYNSNEAIQVAEKVMKFIQEESKAMSEELGAEKGDFVGFEKSTLAKRYKHMRNATTTTVAPTGTISVIAACSSGVEPIFAVAYTRDVSESLGHELVEINPMFETAMIERGLYTEELVKKVTQSGSVQNVQDIPEDVRRVFITALEIEPEWHVRIQAAFQKYTDNAVSKTINFSNYATPHDVEKAFMLAWKLNCKGITVYRYGSRDKQILKVETVQPRNPMTRESNGTSDYSYSAGGCPKCTI